jgi:hypothetical protein
MLSVNGQLLELILIIHTTDINAIKILLFSLLIFRKLILFLTLGQQRTKENLLCWTP